MAAAACATGPKLSPEHSASGGPIEGAEQLPPGPWTVDTLTITDSCGAGAGLLLTQVLKQRGYRVISVGAPTRAELECSWSEEDIRVWEVDTPRAKGECVAEGVRTLALGLQVIHKPYARPGEAEGVLATAHFTGRARLDAEPPHRGCEVRKEEDASLLSRGLRSLAERIPEGAQKAPPLVAPAPAGADVVVGQAGPTPSDDQADSIYPVEFGDRPAPDEALNIANTPGRSAAEVASDRGMPPTAVRGEDGADLAAGPLITREVSLDPFWKRFELNVEVISAACTDFCAELYSEGYGPGIRLIFRAHDLLALEGGWRRISMESRDGVRLPDDVQTVLSDFDLGGRLNIGHPGPIRAFGGLGVAFTELGDQWEGEGQTEGTRFSGLSTRLVVGGEVAVLDWLRLGLHARYDRVDWEEVCERAGACEAVDRFHPISGSDVWSGGAQVNLALP